MILTLNLPTKSHSSQQINDLPPRKYVSLNVDGEVKDASSSFCTLYFKNLSDFTRHIRDLKILDAEALKNAVASERAWVVTATSAREKQTLRFAL